MTKRKKIEILKCRVKQLEEENKILIKNSGEEVKEKIKKLDSAIEEYNNLIIELKNEMNKIRKLESTFNAKEMKSNLKFMKKLNKKINKI